MPAGRRRGHWRNPPNPTSAEHCARPAGSQVRGAARDGPENACRERGPPTLTARRRALPEFALVGVGAREHRAAGLQP
jgi:hypothetical protein